MTRLCLAFAAPGQYQKLAACKLLNSLQVHQTNLKVATSTTPNNSSQSKLAQSLRGSLRNLTWKTHQASDLNRRVFQRKRPFLSKEPPIKEDWTEDFHLITRDDIDPNSPFVPSLDHCATPVSASSGLNRFPKKPVIDSPRPSAAPFSSLPPLVIADSLVNRVSTYTTKTITTTESATPTFTEFAHITASFPQPPSHIPVAFNSPTESSFPHQSRLGGPVNYRRHTPSVTSPISESNAGSIIFLQRIKSKAKDILRIPSLRLSSWKNRS